MVLSFDIVPKYNRKESLLNIWDTRKLLAYKSSRSQQLLYPNIQHTSCHRLYKSSDTYLIKAMFILD